MKKKIMKKNYEKKIMKKNKKTFKKISSIRLHVQLIFENYSSASFSLPFQDDTFVVTNSFILIS